MLVLALGCATNTVQQEPAISRPTPTVVDSVSKTDSTTARTSASEIFHPGNAVYDYQTASVIHVTTGDTIPRVDTTTVAGLVSAAFRWLQPDHLTIEAIINADSFTVRTGLATPVPLPSRTDTLAVHVATGKVRSTSVQSTPQCDIQAQEALVRIDDIMPILPAKPTRIWSDTVVQQVCRAGVQFQVRRVTIYQLDSTRAEPQLLRTTTTTFTGRGNQWNQPVESNGESTSTDTLFLNLTTRRVQQIRGVTQLQLNFRSQLRNQQFQQTTQLLVRLR
jgi:hypothetical protein